MHYFSLEYTVNTTAGDLVVLSTVRLQHYQGISRIANPHLFGFIEI